MKNKIHKYDFLVIGAGLIGSLAALALHKKNFKVLAIDKVSKSRQDKRTLAVNANSKDFLIQLGIWSKIKSKPQPINKIIIKDYFNQGPLIFEDSFEPMGNVVFNEEVLSEAKKLCYKNKILINNFSLDYNNIPENNIITIKDKKYQFKKIILCIGKNLEFNTHRNNYKNNQHSHVGFFNHSKNHKNIAYEIFTKNGPLAVLPSPDKNNLKSTFIYSSKKNTNNLEIRSLIRKYFNLSHGKINFNNETYKYPIIVKINKLKSKFILIGDAFRSIHPVAGQGWNLGIKDIQTLCSLTDQFSLKDDLINEIYLARRLLESALYLSFTSSLNFLYENINPVTKNIIRVGYQGLSKIKIAKDMFIKQAMGRINLIG